MFLLFAISITNFGVSQAVLPEWGSYSPYDMPYSPPAYMYQQPSYPAVPFQYMPAGNQPVQQPPPTATTPANSLVSLIDALATAISRRSQMEDVRRKMETATMTSYKGEWDERAAMSPYQPPAMGMEPGWSLDNWSQSGNGVARIVNSIPPPNIMFRIGDLLDSAEENERNTDDRIIDMNTIQGFPIEKEAVTTSPEPSQELKIFSVTSTEKAPDDDTLLGLLSSGRWKTIDWKRKILGTDEIPTAEEGNALAQMFGSNY